MNIQDVIKAVKSPMPKPTGPWTARLSKVLISATDNPPGNPYKA